MKKSIRNFTMLALCIASCFAVGFACTACNSSGVQFVEEQEKKGPQFLEGALADIYVGETVVLTEYIEYVNDSYSIKITDEEGNEQDLTNEIIWSTNTPGKYVITYTINSGKDKGTSTFTLNVSNHELTWDFTLQNVPYLYGQEMIFEDYFNAMNIYASLEEYEVIMDGVEVDGEYTDLSTEERYVIQSMSDHTFKFHIEADDGQTCEGREVISIKYVDEEYLNQLTDMGISLYGDLYVEDGNFVMKKGSYNAGRNNGQVLTANMRPHDLPYLAYNGEYGLGDFVKVDFTGKNVPLLSFCRDDYTKSAFDGSKGFVVSAGLTNNSGSAIHKDVCSDIIVYGPYMLNKYDEDMYDTRSFGSVSGTEKAPYPGSLNYLDENTSYRMIGGFTGLTKGKAGLLDRTTREPVVPTQLVDTLYLTYQCIILNLDTNEIVSEFSISSYGIQACGYQDIPLETENNEFFKGNIVLYGQHGKTTKLDKIYPIISGKTFEQICLEEVPRATFKETAKPFILLGTEEKVSNFVDTTKENYSFFYRDAKGVDYPVTGDTFTIEKEGKYTLFYKYGDMYYGELDIFVGDTKYKTTVGADGSLVLGASGIGDGANYSKGDIESGYVDQSYYVVDGTYDLDDYVVLDFTGKNMPEIAFFVKNFNNSMYYAAGKQGIVVTTGITRWDGDVASGICGNGTQINYTYPCMIKDATNGGFVAGAHAESKLGRANLVDGTHYRVIMGFTKYNDTALDLKWCLYDLDKNVVVEEGHMNTWNFFTGSNAQVNNMTLSDLVGSIAFYGKFGVETTIDKFWGVYENTSIEELKTQFQNQ